ncbi:polysaccharide deacetylase family protein [Thalassotalea sp. M1531]|uniref:Polysaccharide deacetylase family protein n=1 Tax=Thalassotalea algicola TaxID=2716224 RepID=A0A7Y0LBJ9_9GAMM|nr:polysaccharide deacetylase family protein [Thalassotalea algicola]NMP31509.1 polysaccharide deacetylase family protein [Thalassotalea algicola]
MKKLTLSFIVMSFTATATNAEFSWPNGAKAAISLSYDDALTSHLDNAIPQLNQYGFKGTFYLTLSSPTLSTRLADWRATAAQGHELGNHSISHPCRKSLPNRDWVAVENDLDKQTHQQYLKELLNANAWLHAIDGKNTRTLTLPCGDIIVKGQSILPALKTHFVGIKTKANKSIVERYNLDVKDAQVWAPHNVNVAALIGYAENAANKGSLANYTFHGIGGDHLSVTKEAHEALLKYLASNASLYWVATYREISEYVHKHNHLK